LSESPSGSRDDSRSRHGEYDRSERRSEREEREGEGEGERGRLGGGGREREEEERWVVVRGEGEIYET